MARNPLYTSFYSGKSEGDMMVQIGNSAFTTTLLTKTIATRIKTILAAHVTEGVAYANTDLMYADLSTGVSSAAFSVKRAAGTTNGMTFSFTFVGY